MLRRCVAIRGSLGHSCRCSAECCAGAAGLLIADGMVYGMASVPGHECHAVKVSEEVVFRSLDNEGTFFQKMMFCSFPCRMLTKTADVALLAGAILFCSAAAAYSKLNCGIGVTWRHFATFKSTWFDEVANGIAEGWASKAAMPGTTFSIAPWTKNWRTLVRNFSANLYSATTWSATNQN